MLKKIIIFSLTFLLFLHPTLGQTDQLQYPLVSMQIIVDLHDSQSGHIIIEETIRNTDFADLVRQNIKDEVIIIDEIEDERILSANMWLQDATFSNIDFQILGLSDFGTELKSNIETNFSLDYETKKGGEFIFNNSIITFPEIYENISYKLILPENHNFISLQPDGDVSEIDGKKSITWNINSSRFDIAVKYGSDKKENVNLMVLIIGAVLLTIGIIGVYLKKKNL